MRQKSGPEKQPAEDAIRDIRITSGELFKYLKGFLIGHALILRTALYGRHHGCQPFPVTSRATARRRRRARRRE
jgi:hypothetical protein